MQKAAVVLDGARFSLHAKSPDSLPLMSGFSPQQNPPPRPPGSAPATVQVDGMSGYVMRLPSASQQPRPLQVVQGLDGMIYALTTPAATANKAADDFINIGPTGSVSPNKSSSMSQLSAAGAASVIPQGLNFAAAPSATLLAAAAAAQVQAATAGAQVNIGALAAAAALQGQNPASHQFPFIPVYAPFSMSSSLLTQPPSAAAQTLSLQPLPLGAQVPPPGASPGARTFLLPTRSQQIEDIVKSTPSIQSLLAPNEVLSSDRRTNQSRSTSSSSDCSPSPRVCKTEPFATVWNKSSMASTSALSLNKDPYSPTYVASNYSGLDLAQRGAILQTQIRTAHDHPTTSTQGNVSEEQTKMDTNPVPSSSFQNVKSLSSLSRYMNHPVQAAQMKQDTTNVAGGVSSLEKLLQATPEAKGEACTSTFLQGTSVSGDQSAMQALLQEEPHLSQFYNFFCKSHLSKHLRIRILTTEGGANVLKWIEVTRQASHIDPSFGPIDAARIVISSNGLCKLQLMFPYSKTLSTRFVPTTMAQANELFSELSPKHVVCPGLPDCETKLNTLGYQPTNIRIVETPNMKRYDHEKCPVWHIPLPCNLYSESGQILHHMCKQCKNLLSTLNKTITKIAGLNVGASKNHELPYDLTMMVPSHSAGLSSPPYLIRPSPGGGAKTAAGQEGAKESHGRKRKRRTHPKDDETSGPAVKPTPVLLPEIYQLLRDPAAVTVSHSTTSSGCLDPGESTTITSIAATSSMDKLAVPASEPSSNLMAAPSSVIVQAKGHHQQSDSSIDSDSMAVQQPGGEYNTPEPELVQINEPQGAESQSQSRCSSPDVEVESSVMPCSHHSTEDGRKEVDVSSSPSPAGEAAAMDASSIKKQKIS